MREDTVTGGAEQAALVVPAAAEATLFEVDLGAPALAEGLSPRGDEPWEWVPWALTPGGGHDE